jgi:hypothetical protein
MPVIGRAREGPTDVVQGHPEASSSGAVEQVLEQLDAAVLTCPVSSTAGSYAYDSADRLLPGPVGTARAALRYDALGRRVPSVGTVDRGGDVSLDFAVVHLVASLSQVGRSSAFRPGPWSATGAGTSRTVTSMACIRCSRVAPQPGEQAMQHQTLT